MSQSTGVLTHAIRQGLSRGWTEFVLSLRSSQDQSFYLFTALLSLGYVYLRRDTPVEGTDLMVPSVAIPSLVAALIAFGVVIGPAYSLAMEREDGTLLRVKAAPFGIVGYVVGQLTLHILGILPLLTVILVPSFLLFDGLMADPSGWVTVIWLVALGLLATLPIGIIIGSLVPGVQKVGMWGMTPILMLAGLSGIFYPVQALWGWVQIVVQLFPVYWLGLGMRSAFLPDSLAALELTGSWRTWQTVAVLGIWAIGGAIIAPMVVRRMASRQSGSAVQAARETAAQWVK